MPTSLLPRLRLFLASLGNLGLRLRPLQIRLGLPDLLQPTLPPCQFRRQLLVGLCCLGQLRFHFFPQTLFGLVHSLVAHRFMLAGVGFDLRSVDGHVSEFDQPRFLTELQYLNKQPGQRFEVAFPKRRDRVMIQMLTR